MQYIRGLTDRLRSIRLNHAAYANNIALSNHNSYAT
ncbi:MAG: hypothetical protein QG575_1884 [Euryarchaeota archaeon]|nr:hypothetical protein [Euryarchaeota archaeon]